MLFVPTAQIMAAQAQRRHVAGVRLDGPTVDHTPRWNSIVAALFSRSAATNSAPDRSRRAATVRPA